MFLKRKQSGFLRKIDKMNYANIMKYRIDNQMINKSVYVQYLE